MPRLLETPRFQADKDTRFRAGKQGLTIDFNMFLGFYGLNQKIVKFNDKLCFLMVVSDENDCQDHGGVLQFLDILKYS